MILDTITFESFHRPHVSRCVRLFRGSREISVCKKYRKYEPFSAKKISSSAAKFSRSQWRYFCVFDCNDDTVTFKTLDYICVFSLYDKAFSAPKIISSYRHWNKNYIICNQFWYAALFTPKQMCNIFIVVMAVFSVHTLICCQAVQCPQFFTIAA